MNSELVLCPVGNIYRDRVKLLNHRTSQGFFSPRTRSPGAVVKDRAEALLLVYFVHVLVVYYYT